MKERNLVRVSTYAKVKRVTAQWVYKLGEKGKIKIVEIDKVKFVEL